LSITTAPDPLKVAGDLHREWMNAPDGSQFVGGALLQEIQRRLGPTHTEEQFKDTVRILVERRSEVIVPFLGLRFPKGRAAWHQRGKGGYGFVFEAEDPRFRRFQVALKLLNPLLTEPAPSGAPQPTEAGDPGGAAATPRTAGALNSTSDVGSARGRFEAECKILNDLSYPGGLPVAQDFGEHKAQPYLVMELGGPNLFTPTALRQLLVPPDGRRLAQFVRQLLDVLAYLHGKSIAHRDLKPSNILLPRGESRGPTTLQPMLIDFGIAQDRRPGVDPVTDTGNAPNGSEWYRHPNYQSLCVSPDARVVDIYSFGRVLQYLLDRHVRLRGADDARRGSLLKQLCDPKEAPLPLEAPVGDPDPVLGGLARVAERCCQTGPGAYAEMTEVLTEVSLLCQPAVPPPVAVEPVSAPPPAGRPALPPWRRLPWRLAGRVGPLVVVALGLFTILALDFRANTAILEARLQMKEAKTLRDGSDPATAEAVYRSAVGRMAAFPRRRDAVVLHAELCQQLGEYLQLMGKIEEAKEQFTSAIDAWKALLARFGGEDAYRSGLARAYGWRGDVNLDGRAAGPGEQDYRRSKELRHDLAENHPEDLQYQLEDAIALSNFARLHAVEDPSTREDARREWDTTIGDLRRLLDKAPDKTAIQRDILLELAGSYLDHISGRVGLVPVVNGRRDPAEVEPILKAAELIITQLKNDWKVPDAILWEIEIQVYRSAPDQPERQELLRRLQTHIDSLPPSGRKQAKSFFVQTVLEQHEAGKPVSQDLLRTAKGHEVDLPEQDFFYRKVKSRWKTYGPK
jgi:serine/threonine protein kinase